MRAAISLTFAALMVSSCEYFDELEATLEGLANPLVVEGIFVGVEPVETDLYDFDLSGSDWDEGTALEVFLADATSVDDLDNAPVTGATVIITSEANGELVVNEGEGGSYSLDGTSGLTYTDGEEVTLGIVGDESTSTATLTAPPAAQLSIPITHGMGEALTVDLTGQDFTTVLVLVFDLTTGDIVFSNEPTTIDEIYDFTHSGDGNLAVEIPAKVFISEGYYAIGVAGLKAAATENFVDMNTVLSAFLAGKLVFGFTTTCEFDLEDLKNFDTGSLPCD